MAQSYTRQSTFSDGDTITASLFNNEYNQLLNAFKYSATLSTTGHRHDGTDGQGGNVFKIGDLDFLNKIEADSTNNRWGFYVQVSSAAVEQIRIQDGAIVPVTTNDIDLGTSSLEFKDLFLDGTAHVDTLDVDANATVTGTLGVTGVTTLADNLSVGGNLTVTGNATIAGNLTFGDAATDTVAFSADVASNLLPSADNTYDLGASGSEWKDLYIDGTANIDSLVADTADINGGTIDAADITVGSGKTLDVSAGTLTIADNQISGDKVEGGTIAATTITDLTFGSLDDGTINITAFVDEDNMSSDSATLVPTQQSVKAYVDSQVTAQDLDVTTDSGTIAIDLDSETLTVSGGTGLDSSATGNAITVAIDSTVATLTGSQTLTNKTLTAPVISGNLTTDGLLDGRDVATDGSKLDGVEASADVTDTTNVTAAGALMDSEVTNLAQVKAFDSSDYATAAQGTKADAALPKAGGALTGAITTNSTFDGRDVATDGTKLDGIEASADVTDTANVTSAGALMDSELTAIASVKALNQGVATSDSPSFTNLTLSGTGSVKVPAGTTGQRDGSPAAGMFRYNSSLEQFEGYTSEWGSIGGGGGTNTFTTDSFTGNGSTTAYALSQTTSSEDNLLVFIEGVFQQQDAYSIATASGTTTLTFSAAPANGNAILIYSVASAVSGSNLNIDSMTGDGSDVTLTLSIAPVNENNTQVFIDGVYQSKSNYSISGTTLTFSTAPPTGTAVEVMTFTQTDINVPVDGTVTSAKLSGALTTPAALTVTGALTVDTNTLVVDAANNRVGIGTSSPSALMHLKGADPILKFEDSAGGDTFGIFASASDFLGFYNFTDNRTDVVINGSGNVGIGQATPKTTLNAAANNSGQGAILTLENTDTSITTNDVIGQIDFYANDSSTNGTGAKVNIKAIATSTAGTATALTFGTSSSGSATAVEAMRIDASGSIISSMAGGAFLKNTSGGTSATQIIVSNGAGDMRAGVESSSGGTIQIGTSAYAAVFGNQGNYPTQFTTNGTVRATIDSSGRLLINTTSVLQGTEAKLQVLQTVSNHWSTRINNSATTPYGLAMSYTGASPNNTSSQFLYFADTAAGRFQVNSNGNVGSATSSYGGMSDLKLKENIVDADSQWDDLKAVRVRKYSFKEENSSEPTQIGVIAQEVEAAGMAGLVYESPDLDTAEDGSFVDTGEVTKNMKYSILYMKAVKALQEAMERIETLEAKVQTLENN